MDSYDLDEAKLKGPNQKNLKSKRKSRKVQYVDRSTVEAFIGSIWSIDSSEWTQLGNKISSEVLAIARANPNDGDAEKLITECINQTVYASLSHVKSILNAWLDKRHGYSRVRRIPMINFPMLYRLWFYMLFLVIIAKSWYVDMPKETEYEFFQRLIRLRQSDPPPNKISEWVEGKRVMPSSTPFPGLWQNAKTPYAVEIMDNMSPASSVQHTVIIKGAQLGLTAAAENVIGYWMGPSPS